MSALAKNGPIYMCAHVCTMEGKSSVHTLNLVHMSRHFPDHGVIHSLGSERMLLGREKSPLFTLGQCSLASEFQSTPFSEKEVQP